VIVTCTLGTYAIYLLLLLLSDRERERSAEKNIRGAHVSSPSVGLVDALLRRLFLATEPETKRVEEDT
jgi:hypothetical protein